MPKATRRTTFTVRFTEESTHATLRVVAKELGVSMNRLAEDLISRSLRALALTLQDKPSETLEAIRSYRGEGVEKDWARLCPSRGGGGGPHPDASGPVHRD